MTKGGIRGFTAHQLVSREPALYLALVRQLAFDPFGDGSIISRACARRQHALLQASANWNLLLRHGLRSTFGTLFAAPLHLNCTLRMMCSRLHSVKARKAASMGAWTGQDC